ESPSGPRPAGDGGSLSPGGRRTRPAITLGFGEAQMSHAGMANGVKNVLLVHGGFVDGSGWEGVYKILKKDGFSVTIVQNPTLSLARDVAVTTSELATKGGQGMFYRQFHYG